MKKKNFKIFAGVVLLAACPAMSVYADETGIVKADALNVRSGPSTGCSIIGSLDKGDKVTIVSSDSGWYKIKYDGGTGYVCDDYIKIK